MNPHAVLVTSMGETALSYFGKDNVLRLAVQYSPAIGEASLFVALDDTSRQAQLRILDRFADVEEVFADEVAMTIRLAPVDSADFDSPAVKELAVSK